MNSKKSKSQKATNLNIKKDNNPQKVNALMTGLLGAIAVVPGAGAAVPEWQGIDSNWNNAGNWSNGIVPNTDQDIAYINGNNSSPFAIPVINQATGPLTLERIILDGTGNNIGRLNIINQSVTLNRLYIGSNANPLNSVTNLGTGKGYLLLSGPNANIIHTGLNSNGLFNQNIVVGTDPGNDGTLRVENGAKITSTATNNGGLYIGELSTSKGKVEVDGAGSLIQTNAIFVGNNGQGELNVTNGGNVTSAKNGISIGNNVGSTGLVNVDGAGSNIIANGNFSIGQQGNGTLSITNGAVVDVKGLTNIGNSVNSIGFVEVKGIGSLLNTKDSNSSDENTLRVGTDGNGTLNILEGAHVTAKKMYVGRNSTSTDSKVLVDGEGSLLDTTDNLTVGANTSALLTVSNNAKVNVAGQLSFGLNANSSGNLKVNTGGSVTANQVSIGSGANSINHAEISNGLLNITNELIMGSSSFITGANSISDLIIKDGSKVNIGKNLFLTYNSTSQNTANISGANTEVNIGQYIHLRAPEAGVGKALLTIDDGATVTTSGNNGTTLFLGNTDPVNSGALNTPKDFPELIVKNNASLVLGTDPARKTNAYVGTNSPGKLSVENGGKVVLNNSDLQVGGYYSSAPTGYAGTGIVNIDGAGSELTSTGITNVQLGNAFAGSTGELNVSNGGKADINGSMYLGNLADTTGTLNILSGSQLVLNGTELLIGRAENSKGAGTISGQNTQADIHGLLRVGSSGGTALDPATLKVTDQALVNIDRELVVGFTGDAHGELLIDNATVNSNLMPGGTVGLRIGQDQNASGSVILQNQGKLNVLNAALGNQVPTTSGTLLMTDAGTELNSTTYFSIGNVGKGDASITNQAKLTAANLIVGSAGQGNLNLYNQGQITADTLQIGIAAGSTGNLYVGQDNTGVAQNAGVIDTSTIEFGQAVDANGASQAKLFLNYLDPTWTLDATLASTKDANGAIVGLGHIEQNATGTTYLTADSHEYAGQTLINKGTVSLGNGGTTGNLSGNIQIDTAGTLAFDRSNDTDFAGVLNGTGQVNKNNTNTLTLMADNSAFAGTVNVNNGTLRTNDGNTLGLGGENTSYQINQGGILDVGVTASKVGNVTNDGMLVLGGAEGTTLTVSNEFIQTSNGILDVTVDPDSPDIRANKVSLAGTINISGFRGTDESVVRASEISQPHLLIQSDTQIETDFNTETGLKNITQGTDYLVKGEAYVNPNDNTQFLLSGIELAWTDGIKADANGNFTLTQGSAFNVDVALNDRTDGPFDTGWDGKTLKTFGQGTLYLSADNTYTGGTYIEEGVLSIASGNNVGGSSGIYLGSTNNSNGSTLRFEASQADSGAEKTLTGLNVGNTATIDKDVYLSHRNDNTIDVVNAGNEVTLSGSVLDNAAETSVLSNAGLVKTGAGSLVLAPSVGKKVAYQGDTSVKEGELTFRGDGTQLEVKGDIYNESTLTFDVTSNTMRYEGTVYDTAPTPANTPAAAAFGATPQAINPNSHTIKNGAGELLLTGDSNIAWDVQGGRLSTASGNFNNDVSLAANTTLAFVTDTVAIPDATYSGTLTGAPTSTLEMNRANSHLTLAYNPGSTMGSVNVAQGNLGFALNQPQTNPDVTQADRFILSGSLNVESGATVAIVGSDTYLDVQNGTRFADSSNFEIALDPFRPLAGDIVTKSLAIGNNTTMTMKGFAVPLNYDPDKDSLDRVFKASQLSTLNAGGGYLVVDSNDTIVGQFGNPNAGETINTPNYLLYELAYRDDSNGGAGAAQSEVWLENFRLAWTEGGAQFGTGTFDVEKGTGFNVDVPLPDMPGPFNSGWDGKSLTKTGEGLLILSNKENSFTGDTNINQGKLITSEDDVLDTSSKVNVGKDGTWDVHDTKQHINQLDGSGKITLGDNGEIILRNKDKGGNTTNSHFGGSMIGGNQLHNGGTNSALTVENGKFTITGNIDVDHINLKNDTTLNINNGGSVIGQTNGDKGTQVNIDNGGKWVLTDDSTTGTVNLGQGGTIDFGDPNNNHGTPGRDLVVDNWNGQGGTVNLYGEDDGNGGARNDQIVINNKGTGNTDLNLIDRGGLEDVFNGGKEVIFVKSGPNASIDDDAFHGEFISGTQTFDLEKDPFTGNFVINRNESRDTPLFLQYQSLIGTNTRGSTASSIKTLGDLSDTINNFAQSGACELHNAFARIDSVNGDTNKSGSAGSSSYRQTGGLLGSDWYVGEMNNGCLRVGSMIGYRDTSSNFELPGEGRQGRNKITSKHAGTYGNYQSNDGWYATGAMMYYSDDLSVNNQFDPTERESQSHTMAVSGSLGKAIDLSNGWVVMPEAQLVHQRSNFTDITNILARTRFDNVNTTFAALGSKFSYALSDDSSISVKTNVWHQFDTTSTMKAYGLGDGRFLNALTDKQSQTWFDVKVGFETGKNNWSVFGDVGYEGDFSSSNNSAINGRLGVRHSW